MSWWQSLFGRRERFLSAAQKRDILYNNAARFLRLTPGASSPLKHPE
jgi:predicted TIM-barrel fold metal-dependent hydrolase